jgi:guanylate kinase
VISDVSRPPRKGEVHGMDYNFRSQADMVDDLQNGLYAQIVLSINGDLYGTRPSNYGDGSFAVIGVWAAAVSMFRALHFKEVKVIYVVPPDYDTWQQRVRTHQFTPEEYIRRMQEAKQSLDFATTDKDVQLVMNDDLSLACHRCMDITKSKSLTAPQLASQQQTEHVIKEILSRIS